MTTTPTPAEVLRAGINLINGDLTGVEWKRACRDFIQQATAALAAAPQPATPEREALVEVIREANDDWIASQSKPSSRPEFIADALLARGLTLPVVAHEPASGDTQAPLPITDDTQAERDAAFAAGQAEMRERAAEVVARAGGSIPDLYPAYDAIRALPIKPRPE